MNRSERALAITAAFLLAAASSTTAQDAQVDQNDQDDQDQAGGYYETVPSPATRWGDTGFFDVFSAYTLLKGKVSVAGFRDNIDRSPFSLDISNFAGTVGFGATDKLEIFGRIEVQKRVHAENIGDVLIRCLPTAPLQRSAARGPQMVHRFRRRVVGRQVQRPVGVRRSGGRPLVSGGSSRLPAPMTMKGWDWQGLGWRPPGALQNLGEMAESSYYAGFQLNGSPPDGEIFDIGNAFQWGVGVSLPRDSGIRGTIELTGQSFTGTDFDQTDPVDLLLGVTFKAAEGLFVTAGWRRISISESTGNRFRTQRCHRLSPWNPRQIHSSAATARQQAHRRVQVTANPPEVEEGANSTVTADGNDPDGDPLTYSWRAPDGRITGSGPRVTWTAPTGTEGSFPVTRP